MERHPAVPRPALHGLRATLLLATLLLGGAFHFLHHLEDPACGNGPERTSHVCVACSGLHGSTLVAAETHAPAPIVEPLAQDEPRLVAAPVLATRGQAAPRAPPAS